MVSAGEAARTAETMGAVAAAAVRMAAAEEVRTLAAVAEADLVEVAAAEVAAAEHL
jgi:hypothetical protein